MGVVLHAPGAKTAARAAAEPGVVTTVKVVEAHVMKTATVAVAVTAQAVPVAKEIVITAVLQVVEMAAQVVTGVAQPVIRVVNQTVKVKVALQIARVDAEIAVQLLVE